MKYLNPEEAATKTPIDPEDAEYLRRLYRRERFFNELTLGEAGALSQGKKIDPIETTIKRHQSLWEHARVVLRKAFPKSDLTNERIASAIKEHRDPEAELFGDFITKLKKWVLFVLPRQYSDNLNSVPFAAFRLDTLNALSILLPSGRPAVVLNTGFLDLAPLVSMTFGTIYARFAAAPEGRFGGGMSQESALLLETAQWYASNPTSIFQSKRNLTLVPDRTIWHYTCIFALLHECAHILLGHLNARNVNGRKGDDGIDTWTFTRSLEFDADTFAVKSFLYIEDNPGQEHVVNVTSAVCSFFGFLDLVARYRNEAASPSHPLPTERWSNARDILIQAAHTDKYVKRYEFIVGSLNTERELRSQGRFND